MAYDGIRAHRPLIMGRRGAVATNHPVATAAGLDVLRAGGTAADAAVAVSLALGVVEPHMSGLGGDGFYHHWSASTGRAETYAGTGQAPRAATVDRYRAEGGVPNRGPLSVQTPGKVAGLAALHAAHGGRPWGSLFGAAIEAADDGFAATHALRHFVGENRAHLAADPTSRAIWLPDGQPPAVGELVVQPALAATLRRLAAAGPEEIFAGAVARDLAADLSDIGSIVAGEDLAAVEARIAPPIGIAWRGFEVRQTPQPSMGFAMLQMLRIVEGFDLAALGWGSAALVHLMVEAKKRAFLDREAEAGRDQPDFAALLSDARAKAHAAAIGDRAAHLPVRAMAEADTTYFCAVDAEGNAVSAIQSINGAFGSGVTAPRTGILLNNRMSYWHLEEGHANRLAPGRRVRHTMNAPMVMKDGKPWMVFGTPGADNQVQVNFQVLVAAAVFGMDPQQALEAPRWTSSQPGQESNYPHGGGEVLTIERGVGEGTVAGLRERGHDVKVVPDLEGACSVEAIRVLDNGIRMAGSDPRRDGWAAAY
ncbi:gamma-glutamyltransferase family protein [Roseomonas sp. JC162]|uniref:Gamma-glutamyltransferase family protein n=1 Tax=Neoroseomonas marina TaxID=1232220 RepID=A0A848E5K7_9PROT|nr:gamma-glutamyltransferase family protein [Neoroseomonas marina]NMJ39681.1 gamma-glutamyltransferase family protein [Neoroseomonas marina]